eukprot:UN29657
MVAFSRMNSKRTIFTEKVVDTLLNCKLAILPLQFVTSLQLADGALQNPGRNQIDKQIRACLDRGFYPILTTGVSLDCLNGCNEITMDILMTTCLELFKPKYVFS